MSLCSLVNLTIGVFSLVEYGEYMSIEPRRVTGYLGTMYDEFLAGTKNQRQCLFRPVLAFWKEHLEENKNSSAIRMMQNAEIDLYSIPTEMVLVPFDHPFIEGTKAVSVSSYLVGQFVKPPDNSKRSDLTSFLFQNKQLLMVIMSGYLLITILLYVLSQIIRPCFHCAKRLKRVLSSTFVFDSNGFRSLSFELGLIFLFFNVFMFFNQNFLCATYKTDKITIDTTDVIDTVSKLMETDKTMVVNYEEDSLMKLALDHSFLGKLAQKPRFVLKQSISDKDRNALLAKRMESYFFMSIDIDLYFAMAAFAPYSKLHELVAFIRFQIYRESFLRAFYLRRGLEEQKKRFIHRSVEGSFKAGLVSNWFHKTNRVLISLIEREIKLYRSLEEYIDDLSSHALHSEVRFENLRRAFFCFDIVLLSLLGVFVVVCNLPKVKSIFEIVNLKIRFIAIRTCQKMRTSFSRLKFTTTGVLTISMLHRVRRVLVALKPRRSRRSLTDRVLHLKCEPASQ